jgi:beta-lactamase class D
MVRCVVTLFVLSVATAASAATTCTVVMDAMTGTVVVHAGDRCEVRLTPASTFKIPLSLIGFDSGILRDADRPAWPYNEEYQTWNDAWKKTTTPRTWLEDSVVWYSQVLTRRLGEEKFRQYVDAFDYGNRDISGGLTTAWLGSTLRISAVEQVAFVRRIVRRQLPVSPSAINRTMAIMPMADRDGWRISGKTGTGFHRRADGTNDSDRQVGWFVGWARHGERTLVFARLIEDEGPEPVRAGLRARDALLADWPALMATNRASTSPSRAPR